MTKDVRRALMIAKAEGGEVENDLLRPIGASRSVGDEKPLFDEGMHKAGEAGWPGPNNSRSIRYLHHDENDTPIGALQIRTHGPRTKKATIQNVYVAEGARRKGIAASLLKRARQDFDVAHSTDLTRDGKAFARAVKAHGGAVENKEVRRALMIARDQRALLRRIANIYPGPGGGMDPSPGGGGYSGPGGGKYIGPSHYADGGGVDDYGGEHRPPGPEDGAPLHDLTGQGRVYPDDIYGPNAARYYGHGDEPLDHGTMSIIRQFKGRPSAKAAIYRAVPSGLTTAEKLADLEKAMAANMRRGVVPEGESNVGSVWYNKAHAERARLRALPPEPETKADINPGDWVTINRQYAKDHGESTLRGKYKILRKMVRADELYTNGDSIHEYGYWPRAQRAEGGSVPPFKLYSGAAKIIGAKGQKKATPQQYAAMPGIKPDELKHSKFDTLGSKALPREEVIKHLEDNAVPLQESELRDEQPPNWDGETSYTASKFSEHTLPGGENYREVLLHTPPAASDGFRGNHWDQPNVLAHVRMSDRVGPNGEKILHLEESQSDWGQQGREQGFQQPARQLTPAEDTELAELFDRVPEMRNGSPEIARYNELRNIARGQVANAQGLPSAPYVDNTQKWTDLALKRVLHEAAHGGYDKIVVTPGDEQNKRYDLSRQVKNISYFPDIGYLNGETHDGKGLDEHDVKPGDLAKHIGKEAAERILKQNPQRYEGRGRLGGEFYHELEGDDLKMGGAGMRGYYDNILPKRLQALAQQHDPQAKVNLHAHDFAGGANDTAKRHFGQGDEDWGVMSADQQAALRRAAPATVETAPLHSLDVTPQMRDSIKGNGFNSFKRGGEVEDPIKNWQWRPVDDVRNELQLDEIPSHVHKFGEFMDETARRAATQGLTPRDLIKAYAITRASIGRRALPVETLRSTFPELPQGVEGRVRPEGAMGHWLHTKMGQRYLDAAEAGRVDEEAIAHAQNSMRRFGKIETEPTALRWAAKNLPGREGRVSELIARAHRGQSSPEEWRGEMRVPGVAASKAGFLASMLGRGDQPTLDARQIILHTGRPTKEAAPILGRTGAADAAVNRLADRQTELGFKHDKSMSPFYQHLAHHAIWDKTAGEETTHDDLMQALRGAKDGGRQGYAKGGAAAHPVVAVLRQALPPEAFTDATPSQVRKALERTVSPFSGDPEHVKEALRIASTFKVPTTTTSPGGYYNISQDRSPEEVSVKLAGLPGVKPKPVRKMSWEDLHKKGGSFVNLGGDRSTFGRLTRINGEPLAWPVDLHAGPNYMRELNPGLVWANAPGHATSITNTIRRAADKGPVYGVYAPMGPRAVDSAHHMFDAVMAQIPGRDISKADAAAFDAEIKKGLHMPIKKRPSAAKVLEKWPGILNAKEASEFARTLPGEQRSGIIQHMDKKSWKDKGFPQIGVTRVAITDPDVFKASGNMLGHRVVQLDPDKMVEETKFKHGTYSAPTAGEYVGDVPLVQRHYAAPDVIEQRLMKPTVAGDIIHPYSASPVGRSSARKIFEEQKNIQPLNQRQLDSTMQGLERQKQYGLKTGGRAGYADGGGIDQLLQNLKGSFSNLNQQVAAQAPRQMQPLATPNYQAMAQQATGQAPNDAYQRMVAQALNGNTYEGLFPKAEKPVAPTAPAPVAPFTAPVGAPISAAPDYGSDMTLLLGGDGSSSGAADGGGGTGGAGAAGADGAGGDGGASSAGGGSAFKRGGKVHKKSNIIERALAVTRRK